MQVTAQLQPVLIEKQHRQSGKQAKDYTPPSFGLIRKRRIFTEGKIADGQRGIGNAGVTIQGGN
ncbi:hypothetical protein D3C78_1458350 [compost metagenome]